MHIQPRSKSPIFLLPTSSNHTFIYFWARRVTEWVLIFYLLPNYLGCFFSLLNEINISSYTGHVFLLINYSNIWWIKSVSIVNKLETHDNHELQYQIQIIPSSHLTTNIFLTCTFPILIHQRLTITNPKLFLAMYW